MLAHACCKHYPFGISTVLSANQLIVCVSANHQHAAVQVMNMPYKPGLTLQVNLWQTTKQMWLAFLAHSRRSNITSCTCQCAARHCCQQHGTVASCRRQAAQRRLAIERLPSSFYGRHATDFHLLVQTLHFPVDAAAMCSWGLAKSPYQVMLRLMHDLHALTATSCCEPQGTP